MLKTTEHTMKTLIESEDDLRAAFWSAHPELANLMRPDGRNPQDVRQNQQPCDTRAAWCDFIDHMQKNGDISEELADEVTL